MAALPDADRAEVTADVQRVAENPGAPMSKAQLRAVVNALDDWWETTGAASANAAIPQPQRGLMTVRQKAYLFMRVLNEKYKVL